jgi:hypothetical protein
LNTDFKPRVRMITPIWGKPYIERWLGFGFASQRSAGNIPYLNEHCEFELAIVTKSADAAYMQSSSLFADVMAGIRIRFILMDEFFPRIGEISYGVPLTLAFAKGILDLEQDAIGTYVILMNADCVLASGSLRSIAARIAEGYTVITSQSIRVLDGRARTQLLESMDRNSGILSIEPRDLMRIVNRHLHSTVTARILNEPTIVDSTYYHQIFWRISHECLAMRAFMLHPLCFRVDRIMQKVFCPVDYGFITEICPNGRFCVIGDSDDCLIMELQARDAESHLLRIAPKRRSLRQRLSRLRREIAAVAAAWTTTEHRRSAKHTIYYHENDLPSDLTQRVAPFEAFVDAVLARMSPPVSHVAHFHWVAAVRAYRDNMIRGGSDARVELLDDPRNLSAAR